MSVRKKLFVGFSAVLLLLVIVAGTNIILQNMVKNKTKDVNALQEDILVAENLKYQLLTADDTGAYYLMSRTPQDLDSLWKKETKNVGDIQDSFKKIRQVTTNQDNLKMLDAVDQEFTKYLAAKNGGYKTFQASVKLSADGKTLDMDMKDIAQALDNFFMSNLDPVTNNVDKYMDSLKNQVSQNQERMVSLQNLARLISIILTVIAIIIGGLIAYLLSTRMSKSLSLLQDASTKIADGNLTEQVIVKSKDELGELAQGFNKMSRDLQGLVKEVIDTAGSLGATSQELSAAAEEATASSEQVSDILAQLATGATDQAISVRDTGDVIERLSANAQQVAANAESVSLGSGKAAQAAELGALQAENAVQKMEKIREVSVQTAEAVFKLGDQSKQIGQIVDVIKGIADQTNLLALNAAIEAARAGEQGRGFAVVAEEVRKLAEQSSASATQIATLIGNIQRETERAVEVMEKGKGEVAAGVEAVNLAGNSFRTIVEEVNTVVDQIQQITVATQQMASGTSQAVKSVESIGVIAEQSATSAQEVSAASEEQAVIMVSVSQSAEALAKLGESLSLLVSKFRV